MRLACPRTHREVLEHLRRRSSRGQLLDVGCGPGALAQELADSGYDVTAVDFSPPRPSQAPGLLGSIRADLASPLPFADASFDVITCIEVVEHVEDQFHLIREIARVVRPGGLVIVTTPNVLNLASRSRFLFTGTYPLFERPVNEDIRDPANDHIHPVSYYQLRYVMRRIGLEILAIHTDRYRSSALWLSPLLPLVWGLTHLALSKEKEPSQRQRNRDVARHVLSPALLFGRTLMVHARKPEGPAR